jgi:hypothetical protein
VNPRAGLDDVEKSNWPYRDSNSEPFVAQPVASRYTDCAIQNGEVMNVYSISVKKLKGGDEKLGGNKEEGENGY